MPTWLKIVLGILIGSVVICGGVVGACALYAKHKVTEFKEEGDSSTFAKNNTQDACLPEGLKKVKECDPAGVLCIGKVTYWEATCLASAQPSPTFCSTVPLNGPAAEAWQQQQCASVGLTADKKGNDARCGAVLTMVVQHCVTATYDGGSGMGKDEDEGNNEEPPADDNGKDEKEEKTE